MEKNIPRIFDLIGETLRHPNFGDMPRLKNAIVSASAAGISSIADAGHSYAMLYASASVSPSMFIKEMMEGISQIFYVQSIATSIADKLENLASTSSGFGGIWDFFSRSGFCQKFSILGSKEETVDASIEHVFDLFSLNLPVNQKDPHPSWSQVNAINLPNGQNTYFDFPFNVASTASSFATVSWNHPDSILASILSSKFLHREIREVNGAYGGGASFSDLSGVFSFYSYRDPFPLKSLDSFKRAIDWAKSPGGPTEQDVLEAKFAIFKSLDAPVDINVLGHSEFLYGISEDQRNERREKLLGITLADIVDLIHRWWPDESEHPASCSVVIGGKIVPPDGWRTIAGLE